MNCCSPETPNRDMMTVGRIVTLNATERFFTTVSDMDLSSAIRFNVPRNVRVFDMFGRPISFSDLFPGLRVEVRHASFMTASIPPQTTAFEIRVLRQNMGPQRPPMPPMPSNDRNECCDRNDRDWDWDWDRNMNRPDRDDRY